MRHLDSGDQAGFALGSYFLVGWFLPMAAIALLIGATLSSRPLAVGLDRSGWDWVIAIVLIACAGFFLIYGLALVVPGWWPSSEAGRDWTFRRIAATIIAFSANVLACALTALMAPKLHGSAWGRSLSGILLATSVVVLFQIVGFSREFVEGEAMLMYFPLATGPSLIWIVALLWSAWRLNRAPAPAAQA